MGLDPFQKGEHMGYLLNEQQAAQTVGITPRQLRRWTQKGYITVHHRSGPGNYYDSTELTETRANIKPGRPRKDHTS